jgi:NADPH-dependent 7-cyano-7-deazaguanine reductase QueF-like protein
MTHQDLPLGRHVDYPREYDAALLFPIPERSAAGTSASTTIPCRSPAWTAGMPTS